MGYSIEEINTARDHIKKVAIDELFAKKGGANFVSLSGKDIRRIFDLYDDIFFQNQIKEKIGDNEIRFSVSRRTSGAGGVCTVERGCVYYFDISPNILNTIFKYSKSKDAAGIGCKDRVECLLLIMEHQIIHLLMILWDYVSLEETNATIYGTHGSLFRCMIKEYFGHTSTDHDLGLLSIDVLGDERSPAFRTSSFGYAYWSNSCYLDSLMIVLLENTSSFWRIGLMETDVNKISYKRGICDIGTPSNLQRHAQAIQNQIKLDFKNLHMSKSPSQITCSRLRNLLSKCLPEMRVRGTWVTFNAGAIYNVLAEMFPLLLMDVPVQIRRWSIAKKTWLPEPVKYQKMAMFTMWDYLDPLTDIERGSDYKEVKWDLLQSPGIVFYNGGTPRIKNFGQKGLEKGVNIIDGTRHSFSVYKMRNFGTTIINGRYRLVGVVSLQGVAALGEGGAHYIAYLLGSDGDWYHYNDMNANIVKIKGLPQTGVWKEEKGVMPSLYFYQKIRDTSS